MKKRLIIYLTVLFYISIISACTLDVNLINQDPYPAIPGDYVKLVFQLTGIENPDCGTVSFELLENYPISFDPNTTAKIETKSGTYQRDFNSYLIIPYKVRLDENALDGENKVEVKYKSELNPAEILKTFYIEVEDTHADFELHIKKYLYDTKDLTIEIINIEEIDIEALTLEIPKQENIEIRGTNRIVVGDIDSNEYTTADFKAIPKDGEIEVKIMYTDTIGTRREIIKKINYDSSYFIEREDEKQKIPTYYYAAGIIIIFIIIIFSLKRRKKKKERVIRNRGNARL